MRTAVILVLSMATALAAVPVARAAVTAEQVRVAIERGTEYLKRQQKTDGRWDDYPPRYEGGVTALCTLALLESGVSPDDDAIQRALGQLRKLRPDKTYVVSLQTMAFCQAHPDRDRALIERNVRWLESHQISSGQNRGAWAYPESVGDNSNSQFALLALHEAERVGVEVDGRTWRLAKAYWENAQNPDGSWGYMVSPRTGTGSDPPCGSMTCAGIAALVITSDMIRTSNAEAEGDTIRCCLNRDSEENRIDRALQWLGSDRVFAVSTNPGRTQYWLYYLYALERAGRLTAQRFIGRHDWYREGADYLLQKKGGAAADYWIGVGTGEDNRLVATSFALLFLAKGRRPVLLAKLKHGSDNDWNQHRNDVNNLTRYVESKWKRDLTWQVIDVRAAAVEDLLESPVLYLCGGNDVLPAAGEAQDALARKLRAYLDRGGFLFAEAYCKGEAFDRGFRRLIEKVFPEPEYRLEPLPPGHPVWRTEEAVPAEHVRPLWGVDFGCRTSVVYCPPDDSGRVRPSLSCLWELSRSGRDRRFPSGVQAQIDAGKAIGINVLAYATNRELRFKDPSRPETVADGSGSVKARGELAIANLRHFGGCNAAPRALPTLAEVASRELRLRVRADERELRITDEAIFDHPIVFMHGRSAFHLTEVERKQLRTYVERGGVLLANSICASRQFTDAFRREMRSMFPESPLEPIPGDHAMFTPAFGGYDLSTVTRRDPQTSSRNEPLRDLRRKVAPEFEGVKLDDRYGVVFSRYDLSCALEKHDSLECQGYVREDAARLALNVLLYALQQ